MPQSSMAYFASERPLMTLSSMGSRLVGSSDRPKLSPETVRAPVRFPRDRLK